jgi:sulfite exporter TauE/SafE
VALSLSLLSLMAIGFLLGMRHSTDPDHVVAVTTIATRERSFRSAAAIGVFWGLGHTLTMVVLGGAIVVFGLVIPPHLGLGLEFTVAVMLVVLGVWNLRAVFRKPTGRPFPHAHPHAPVESDARSSAPLPLKGRLTRVVRPFVVGLVHGLAGSGAVAILVVGMMPSPAYALVYLLVFGVGTIAGMLLVTTTLAVPFAFAARRFQGVHRGLGIAAAVASVLFGGALMYELGFVHGLLTSHPTWTPQ